MSRDCFEDLMTLSAEIEREDQNPEPDLAAGLTLRALRIHMCLDLMERAPAACRSQLQLDWAAAAEAVRTLSGARAVNGQVLSDTLDLVLLPDPDKRQALLKTLGLMTRLKIRETSPLSPPVKFIALDMAQYCLDTDFPELLCEIVRNLIILSESRNVGYPEVQRVVVVDALAYIADQDRSLTAQLCRSQQKYFEGVADGDSCQFYWYYGMSVLSGGASSGANTLLKHCYELCMEVEGETSWIGARAGSVYHYSLLKTDRSAAAEAYLWDTVRKIEAGFYADMDEDAEFYAANTRMALLSTYMDRGQLRNYFDDVMALLYYCISVKDKNTVPHLTVRKAENLLSAYHLEAGEPLLSATHAQLALSSIPPEGVAKEPSDILLYTNLLLIYRQLHDEEQIEFYTQKLLDLEEEWGSDPYLSDRIYGILFPELTDEEADEDDLAYNREVLTEAFDRIRAGSFEIKEKVTENTAYAWFVINLCLALIDDPAASGEELIRIRFVMDYFRNHPQWYPFSDQQNMTYYWIQTRIEDRLGGPAVLDYLDLAWQHMDALTPGMAARVSFCRFAAALYCYYGHTDRALEATNLLLSDATASWQKAATYLTDQRVCQVLSTVQDDLRGGYTLMRYLLSGVELYERLLRFKDLPALVGRERSALLRSVNLDEELISGLHDLQDRLADAQLNDSLRGTDTARKLREDLEFAEAATSAQFTEAVRYTDITFEGVCEKLPDSSAIVEYYFGGDESSIFRTYSEGGALELDIFITAKVNGQIRFQHLRRPGGSLLEDEACDLFEILQEPDDLAASGKKAVLRGSLYRGLIAPVLPFLEGVTNLYIAPDTVLCVIPFEILYGEDRIPLQDRFRICRLVCGRDLLFFEDQEPSGGGCFVLGDPDYEAQRGQSRQSRTRGSESLKPVDALPFSGVEVRHVAKHCRSDAYTGEAATKYALRDALPCRMIHLATHGVYDEELEADSLYTSHLVFAGYNRWVRNQTESSHCGNGILTADEISRMDMTSTELVVLSACQSGIGDVESGSVRGLLSAFSAAGARWIVSHMWEADDFTTPILMDAFYEAWLKKGMEVPEALQYAKNHLKNITIAQLRQEGWLDLPRDIPFPEEMREAVEEMQSYPDREMPFRDEFYWGGFTVHKSR